MATELSAGAGVGYGALRGDDDDDREAAAVYDYDVTGGEEGEGGGRFPRGGGSNRRRRMYGRNRRATFERPCRPQVAMCAGLVLAAVATCTAVLFVFHAARVQAHRHKVEEEEENEEPGALVDKYMQVADDFLRIHFNDLKTTAPAGCESTLVLVRHCEKGPQSKGHCNYVGAERATYLASLFGEDPDNRWPTPVGLYALSQVREGKKHGVMREIETLEPLSERIGVEIDSSFEVSGDKLVEKVSAAMRDGSMCGKVSVISWKHTHISKLAQKFGCGPLDGCPMEYPKFEYDQTWQLKFVYGDPNVTDLRKLESSSSGGGPGDGRRAKEESSSAVRWEVYGSVVYQGYDPLSWSRTAGDYPKGGKVAAASSTGEGEKKGTKKDDTPGTLSPGWLAYSSMSSTSSPPPDQHLNPAEQREDSSNGGSGR